VTSSDSRTAAPQHNIWAIYDAVALAVPERPAFRIEGRSLSHRHVRDRSIRLANFFASQGLGLRRARRDLEPWQTGQDLIGTYLLNGAEYLEVSLAGYAARAAPFNVNYRYVDDELAYLLDDARAGALVFHARFADRVAAVCSRLSRQPLLVQVADDSGIPLIEGALDYETVIAPMPATLEVTGHDPDDLYVVYTGGTTGMPKGTLWRQADIWTAALGGDQFAAPTLGERRRA
jgi:acyl-CoA synthetase (AMP-forming)/AMP-acid ligase II